MNFNCKIFINDTQYIYCNNIQPVDHKKKYRSLLEILEFKHIPINYQCRSGYCGSCRCLLIKGRIQYYKEPLIFLNPKEILICCCLPKGNIILKL